MGMAGDADHAVEQIVTAAGEVVLEDIVAFPPTGRTLIVPSQSRRLHHVLHPFEVRAIDIAPPAFVWGKVVEVIAPFAELDCVKNARSIQGVEGSFILPAEDTPASLDLHVGTARVGNDGPADCGQVIE